MSVQVNVEKLEHSMAKLTITVPADRFIKAVNNAYLKQRKNIAVPGFRKGKAPLAIVEKMYGPEMFYEDAANEVINDTYGEALEQLEDLMVTSRPAFDLVQIQKGQEFIYTAEVATRPEVKLGEYKGLEVEVEDCLHVVVYRLVLLPVVHIGDLRRLAQLAGLVGLYRAPDEIPALLVGLRKLEVLECVAFHWTALEIVCI